MTTERLYCGIDVGASNTKLVLLDDSGNVMARVMRRSGVDYAATCLALVEEALDQRLSSQIACTVATGYGRSNVPFAELSATEIQCHGLGCYHQYKGAIVVVDIGAQDNKVIRLDENGSRISFKMNRKCAAGTGSFLEEMAQRLAVDISEFNAVAKKTTEAVTLSSFCTVFAKTEVLSHLRQGASLPSLVRGAYEAVVARVLEMDPLDGRVVLTGGVAEHHATVAKILQKHINKEVEIPDYPQFTGALGAALYARNQAPS